MRLRIKILIGLSLIAVMQTFPVHADENVKTYMDNARIAFDRADVISAVSWYRKAAELGYAPAQTRLGYLLDQYEENEEAVKWYQQAAQQGHAEAQYRLSGMYAAGEGVKQDKEQALTWMVRAAEQQYPLAIQVLALAYEQGELGLMVDYEQALAWLNKGVDAGDPWSIKRLIRAYQTGELGVRIDLKRVQSLQAKLPSDAK